MICKSHDYYIETEDEHENDDDGIASSVWMRRMDQLNPLVILK